METKPYRWKTWPEGIKVFPGLHELLLVSLGLLDTEVSPRHTDSSFLSYLSRFYNAVNTVTVDNSIILPPTLNLPQTRVPYHVQIWNCLRTPIEQVASLVWQKRHLNMRGKPCTSRTRSFCDQGKQYKNKRDPQNDELLWEIKTHSKNWRIYHETYINLISGPNEQLFLALKGSHW